jgi:hypothetical protein
MVERRASLSRTAETRPYESHASSSFRVRTQSCVKKVRSSSSSLPPESLLAPLRTLAPLDKGFPPIADPTPEPVES